MKEIAWQFLLLGGLLPLSGCATYDRHGLGESQAQAMESSHGLKKYSLTAAVENRILALNPRHVTEQDIRTTLASAPAPHIINIHGGIAPVQLRLTSYSKFLVGMGYPETCLRNPSDGTWTFSCYEDSDTLVGMIAWFYEKEGLRPMILGHSQGGMQAVRILGQLAGKSPLHVWSPLTWKRENRCQITDPLTGRPRSVTGLRLPYVASMGAGGLTRILPNQWDMNFRLRTIPDTAEEFTGFYKGNDILGGDLFGYGPMNHFHASGHAAVRNVRLPTMESHARTPEAEHLLKSRQIMNWINDYTPIATPNQDIDVKFDSDSKHILFAADVWYSIKKHWVIELQNLIRAPPRCPNMICDEIFLRRAVVFGSAIIYWGGVCMQARRVRKQIGRAPNLKPHGTKEKLLWLGWLLVIATWIGQPFLMHGEDLVPISRLQLIVGMMLVFAGYAATLWCYAAMGSAWRIGVNQSEKNSLITCGPYRAVRHPIYLFQVVMLAGTLLLIPTVLSFSMVAVHLLCTLIKAADEEKYLLAVYGEIYRAYLARTGSLLPKIC